MNIKILGSAGCSNCQGVEANVKQALSELKMEAEVEKVNDMEKIMSYGVMSVPAIVVDDEVVSFGVVPAVSEIKKMLTK